MGYIIGGILLFIVLWAAVKNIIENWPYRRNKKSKNRGIFPGKQL